MTYPSGYGVLSLVPREVLVRLLVVLPELLHDVLADVAVLLLDLARHLELVFWWYVRHLASLAHEVQDELGDITTCDWDVLDSAPDDIALRTRNDVCDTITRVDNGSSECAVGNTVRGPRRG